MSKDEGGKGSKGAREKGSKWGGMNEEQVTNQRNVYTTAYASMKLYNFTRFAPTYG